MFSFSEYRAILYSRLETKRHKYLLKENKPCEMNGPPTSGENKVKYMSVFVDSVLVPMNCLYDSELHFYCAFCLQCVMVKI